MAELHPFRAFAIAAPWSILVFDMADGFRVWKPYEWVRHRGGKRMFFADVAAERTIRVDHLAFEPKGPPGLGRDAIGRLYGKRSISPTFRS